MRYRCPKCGSSCEGPPSAKRMLCHKCGTCWDTSDAWMSGCAMLVLLVLILHFSGC